MQKPKFVEFGQYKGLPLSAVPSPYLIFMMTRANVRVCHPAFVADALDVLAGRLLVDFDAVLAELLAPVPADAIARAKAKKVEAKKAQLAKLLAQRGPTP